MCREPASVAMNSTNERTGLIVLGRNDGSGGACAFRRSFASCQRASADLSPMALAFIVFLTGALHLGTRTGDGPNISRRADHLKLSTQCAFLHLHALCSIYFDISSDATPSFRLATTWFCQIKFVAKSRENLVFLSMNINDVRYVTFSSLETGRSAALYPARRVGLLSRPDPGCWIVIAELVKVI
ncbi:hypothetical protein ARMSODRAFT_172165 [Armillaria solidipes]|uniref:Uncharacterized protein n=1 Tax=Armillaria solidipes TaxID=1076256 RepID=A0A2H3BJD6_9AGAR|nr:hypothetical protein ARMSODRAFT_172165 [Armillaria solidipes]